MGNADQTSLASLRALTRNLPNNGDASLCSGDGGCSSAMRTRSGRVFRFGEVTLPASKSESNRALMIAAYGGFAPDFQNLSDSNDTQVLNEALVSMSFQCGVARSRESMHTKASFIDIADCGTAARFMTTYMACHEGEWLLTGTERMKQRPILPLVKSLRELGADIQFVEKEGCLPLRIKGKPITGGEARIDMHQSSQFASSVLLAAPMWPDGLEMELKGELTSLPYLEMTLAMMRHFGAEVERNGRTISVKPRPYQASSFVVGGDWSAASYWYEMAALSEECEIRLHGLAGPWTLRQAQGSGTSILQGDVVIVDWMKQLGVGTFVENNAIVLRKNPFEKHPVCFDFAAHPDLYPTMAATCTALNVDATFTGLDNLALKESDRVEAMQAELSKLGSRPLQFCSHNDHRIVMALAPLALLYGPISFDHPEVVEKSYPGFWSDCPFLQAL